MSLERQTVALPINPELWMGKPKKRIATELTSWSLESRLIPDPGFLRYSAEGRLIDPDTGDLVVDCIEKASPLGRIEYEGFLKIEDCGWKNEEGVVIAWCSPPHPLRSGFTKIEVCEIIDDEESRGLIPTNILIKLSPIECLVLAKQLGASFTDPEELRRNPIPIMVDGHRHWTYVFQELLPWTDVWGKIRAGEHLQEKEETTKESDKLADKWHARLQKISTKRTSFETGTRIISEAKEGGLVGSNSSSCPTAFDFLSEKSNKYEATFECPRCHGNIPSGRGITTCPHCGARKEDYKACA